MLAIVVLAIKIYKFNKTTYHKATGNSFYYTFHNLGARGEYEIFKKLSYLEKSGCKFLFNLYLPKENGETTEADVVLIAHKGIVVFESKNYSGWIFGDEAVKIWTQTLPQGRGKSEKNRFLNPIMQNKLHIKALKAIVGNEYPIYSIIVFSERCTLKKITVRSGDVKVVNRQNAAEAVGTLIENNLRVMDNGQIGDIYNLLYPYSQVSEAVKAKHIENIKKGRKS